MPKTPKELAIEHALSLLREAATMLRYIAPKAHAKARSAIKSAEGAQRHAQNMATRAPRLECQHDAPAGTGQICTLCGDEV